LLFSNNLFLAFLCYFPLGCFDYRFHVIFFYLIFFIFAALFICIALPRLFWNFLLFIIFIIFFSHTFLIILILNFFILLLLSFHSLSFFFFLLLKLLIINNFKDILFNFNLYFLCVILYKHSCLFPNIFPKKNNLGRGIMF